MAAAENQRVRSSWGMNGGAGETSQYQRDRETRARVRRQVDQVVEYIDTNGIATTPEIARTFGWSIAVAKTVLRSAFDRGLVKRDRTAVPMVYMALEYSEELERENAIAQAVEDEMFLGDDFL
jgi:ribosomal protein S25